MLHDQQNQEQITATFGVLAERDSGRFEPTQTGQCAVAILPSGLAHYSEDISVAPGEFAVPAAHLPSMHAGQKIAVTQSIASAHAIRQSSTGIHAVAALDANNLRNVVASFKTAGCDVVVVPDNFDLSRAAARDAARATGARLAQPIYEPGQPNLHAALNDALREIAERFPTQLDPRDVSGTLAASSERMAAGQAAQVDLIIGPLSDAKPWSPGMGRSERIAQVSRAISTGAEIGR